MDKAYKESPYWKAMFAPFTSSATRGKSMIQVTLLALAGAAAAIAVAQQPTAHSRPGQASKLDRELVVAFAKVNDTVHFPVTQLDRHVFNPMFCAYSFLPKGFGHTVPVRQGVVQMEWGYKKGGIVNVYETPAYGPGNSAQFFKDLEGSHVFRDRESVPGFAIVVVPNAKVFTIVTSVDKPALALAVEELKGK